MANGPLNLWVSQNFSQISRVSQSRFFLAVMCLSQSQFIMKRLEVSIFFKGKEVSFKALICLFVFINFDVFSSLDIEFHNTAFKFPRNKVNPKLSEFHKTYRHVILAPASLFWYIIMSFEIEFPVPASSQKLVKRLKGASRKLRKNHDVLCLSSAARIESESLTLGFKTL